MSGFPAVIVGCFVESVTRGIRAAARDAPAPNLGSSIPSAPVLSRAYNTDEPGAECPRGYRRIPAAIPTRQTGPSRLFMADADEPGRCLTSWRSSERTNQAARLASVCGTSICLARCRGGVAVHFQFLGEPAGVRPITYDGHPTSGGTKPWRRWSGRALG